ncbi:MAG: lipid-A-disaccharide synthase, partial [Candidatus Margulisiibacteriota bacterium]
MKIMLSAGEVSGDVHGAYLVRELKKLNPDIYFFGMGSERLSAEGVDIKYDITSRGSIGLLEAFPNAFPIYLTYKKMIGLMRKERPNLLILIDSQGFNLPLAKEARKLGIRTVYYIAPQDWLWGTPAGVKKVAATAGLIVAIFEKEYDSYKKAGANVIYFGHPLIDIVKTDVAKKQRSAPLVAICPGSRPQEIKGLLSILVK